MRIVLSVFVMLMVFTCIASADQYDTFVNEQYDFATMTDEQLQVCIDFGNALIRNAQQEFDKRTGNINAEKSDASFSTRYADFTVNAYIDNMGCLLVEYNWTNTTDSARSFMLSLSRAAYQNGKELHSALSLVFDENHMSDILPGYSAVSYDRFHLEDDSEITVLINTWPNKGSVLNGVKLTFYPKDLDSFDLYKK